MKIEVSYDHRYLRLSRKETIRVVRSVLRREGGTLQGVSVVYTNSARIRTINRKYLTHDFVTDVIAFELEAGPALETEIYVNLDRARSQAKEYGQSFGDETRRLVIHGLLHTLGYDDKSGETSGRMRREENAVLENLRGKKK